MAETSDVTFHVRVDFEAFKQIYLAQNRKYQHKLGVMCAILGAVLTVVGIMMMVSEGVTLESLGYTALFVVVLVFGCVMASRPVAFFQTRKNEVRTYFANHGAEVSTSDPIESLVCEFDVTVCDPGFIETFADGQSVRLPWFALTGDDDASEFGHIFTGDDGKNSSMLYNMLGINGLIREGVEGEPLPVPAAAVTANPELVKTIGERIQTSRAKFGGRGKKAKDEQANKELAAWLEA